MATLSCCGVTAADTERRHVDLHARPHGRGDRDAVDEVPLAPGGLGLLHRIGERLDVLDELVVGERGLADAGLHDAGLLDAELDRAALGALHGAGDVHRDRADLRVRHQAARAQHLAEPADQRHHVGRGDAAVEVDLAALHLLDQILGADDVGAGGLGLVGLGAAREHARRARVRPVPFGRLTTPRTIWSAWRGSTPRFIATSMVSSNFALARSLTIFTASSSG